MHGHARTISAIGLVVTLVLTCTPALRADPPRHINAPMPEAQSHETYQQLVTVPAPEARRLAVSEPANAIVLVNASSAAHDLTIVPLTDTGQLADAPRRHVSLPAPGALSDYRLRVLGIETHPQKPLVYLWRDVVRENDDDDGPGDPPASLVHANLDHLLVYELDADGAPKLVQRTCRGERYAFGKSGAALDVDAMRNRLYVPNSYGVRDSGGFYHQMAYATLDDAGRVMTSDDDPGAPTLVGQMGNKFLFDSHHNWPFDYMPVNDERVMFAAEGVLVTWDKSLPSTPLFRYSLPGMGGRAMFSGHPELEVVYAVAGSTVYRVRHADGFLTLMPQRIDIEDARFSHAPVIPAAGGQIVVPDHADNQLLLVGIEAQGKLTGDVQAVRLPGHRGGAMAVAYAAKFDRVYARTNEALDEALNEPDESEQQADE